VQLGELLSANTQGSQHRKGRDNLKPFVAMENRGLHCRVRLPSDAGVQPRTTNKPVACSVAYAGWSRSEPAPRSEYHGLPQLEPRTTNQPVACSVPWLRHCPLQDRQPPDLSTWIGQDDAATPNRLLEQSSLAALDPSAAEGRHRRCRCSSLGNRTRSNRSWEQERENNG